MITKQRDITVDLAKGLVIFLVVWGHTGTAPVCIWAFLMLFFFMISGFFFKPDANWSHFLKTKFHRLLIPFLCFWFLCSGYQWLVQSFGLYSYFSLSWSQLYDPGNGTGFSCPLWFLPALFWLLLAANAVWLTFKREWLRFLSCAVISIAAFYLSSSIGQVFYVVQGLICLLFFYVGHAVRNIKLPYFKVTLDQLTKSNLLVNLSLIAIFTILFFAFQEELHILSFRFPEVHSFYIAAIFGSLAVWLLCILLPKALPQFCTRYIAHWGRQSLGIMAIHYCILYSSYIIIWYCVYGFNHIFVNSNQLTYSEIHDSPICMFFLAIIVTHLSLKLSDLISRYLPWMLGEKRHS